MSCANPGCLSRTFYRPVEGELVKTPDGAFSWQEVEVVWPRRYRCARCLSVLLVDQDGTVVGWERLRL